MFDALAAGCLVITNAQSVSDACFDGLLPVYRDAAHLEVLLDRYLNDLAAMKALAATLQVQVGNPEDAATAAEPKEAPVEAPVEALAEETAE